MGSRLCIIKDNYIHKGQSEVLYSINANIKIIKLTLDVGEVTGSNLISNSAIPLDALSAKQL